MKTPPVYLLVWFAYYPDRQLQVVDRMTFGLRTTDCPVQLRYVWVGMPEKVSKKYLTKCTIHICLIASARLKITLKVAVRTARCPYRPWHRLAV